MVFKFVEKNGKFCLQKDDRTILEFEERDNTVRVNNSVGVNILAANVGGETETKITVNTDNIAASAVTTAKIANANVTTAKIANANVTTAKIANDAVTGEKINAPTVTVTDATTYDSVPPGMIFVVNGSGAAVTLNTLALTDTKAYLKKTATAAASLAAADVVLLN